MPVVLEVVAALLVMAMLEAEAAMVRAPHTKLEEGLVAEAIAEAEATQTAMSLVPHTVATMPAVELKKHDARSPPRLATTTGSPPSLLDFAICFSQRNSNLLGSPSPVAQMLRPIHRKRWWQQRHKVPLLSFLSGPSTTHLARIARHELNREVGPAQGSVDNNFAGAMGHLGTHMDLAMVKQEQDETLRKYMGRFFDKRATVVDVTDQEIIDLFKDGLYHHCNFEDFYHRRSSSITKLKDMITPWVDKEDKANTKYNALRGKSKNNTSGSNNNNRDQGGCKNNNNSGPNCKCKPDNTVAAI
jgi:hypothetical protein